MPKILSLSLEDEDLLCELAASLSSPARAVKSGMVEQRLHAIWKTPHSRTIGNRLPSEWNARPESDDSSISLFRQHAHYHTHWK